MIKIGRSCAVWSLPWLMRSRIQMRQLTSTTQSKMSMISWSRAQPLLLWILWVDLSSAVIADRKIKIKKRYGRLAQFPFPRTRILSTSGVAVLCIFSLGRVCWRGVYLLFLQLQQLMRACFQQWVTWWLKNVHVSRGTKWRSSSISTRCGRRCGIGRRSRRCAWSDLFFESMSSLVSWMSSIVSCLLTLRLHLNVCDFESRPLFLVSLFLSLYTHIYIHILLLLLYTIIGSVLAQMAFPLHASEISDKSETGTWEEIRLRPTLYFLVLTKPAPAWVPVKASFSTSDTIVTLPRTGLYHYVQPQGFTCTHEPKKKTQNHICCNWVARSHLP